MPGIFVHSGLQAPGSEIRLLELLPGTGKDKVQCRLSAFPISRLPPYQPLSYCWGSQTNPIEILVNGKSLFVTRNLYAALRRLRQPSVSRVMWVDAVCINQADNLEKSSQIQLMGEIYRRGDRTIIWLGEHDRKTGRAFAMLEAMVMYANTIPKEKPVRLHPDKWQFIGKTFNKKSAGGTQMGGFKANVYSPAYWTRRIRSGHARTSVFSRAWFKRVWIVQEIAMSQRAVVVCGKYSTHWESVETAYAVSELWNEWEDGQYLQTLTEIRAGIQAGGTRDDLGNVILKAARSQAALAVDRIYAVLGLAKSLPQGLEIAIDYEAAATTKFSETTRACILSSRNLQLVLDGRGRPADYDGRLPSWAWSPRLDPDQPAYQWQFHRAAATNCRFNAARRHDTEKPLTVRFSDDGRLLFARGIVFDEVVAVGPVFGDIKIGYAFQATWSRFTIGDYRWPRHYLRHLHTSEQIADLGRPGPYPGKPETRRQAWIGFLAGILMMSDGRADESKARDIMRTEVAFMKPYHILGRGPGELPWSRKPSPPPDPQMPRIRPRMLYSDQIKGPLLRYLAKRRVVRTSQGYIGLANRYTEAGDHLALVDGLCVPLVLRPALGSRWRILGESYVYGTMHGELWFGEKVQSLCFE
ncbi:Heterokaryon incompatibility [Niveomyces insectorum RCEF 264]|uniref:Heterokaryon incompatibility n=1 Tax=Niveomyces insectorum RCEF 264 TaxID=1081102 RepID=A0A167Y450_9HYPO|nr:Heterokaryon incompatibility [Niveomyces insectorum RCEF 264]